MRQSETGERHRALAFERVRQRVRGGGREGERETERERERERSCDQRNIGHFLLHRLSSPANVLLAEP